jgi:hypothetical protein
LARGNVSYLGFFYATNIPRSTEDDMYYKWELTHTMVLERSCVRRPS